MKKMTLGDRIKLYEGVNKHRLMSRSYTIIRLDGRGFSKYTKGLPKPFDKGLMEDMIETTKYLCENIQNCKLGYTQSDEITLVLTDFDTYQTQGWFDNELQKCCSISASMATAKFNQLRTKRALSKNANISLDKIKLANFDSRIFQVPTLIEVNNVLIWRQRDFYRNSISVCAQALYSAKELNGKNTNELQELIFQKGKLLASKFLYAGFTVSEFPAMFKDNFNWNDLPPNLKRGTTFMTKPVDKVGKNGEPVVRNEWIKDAFEFSSTTVELLPILDNSKL